MLRQAVRPSENGTYLMLRIPPRRKSIIAMHWVHRPGGLYEKKSKLRAILPAEHNHQGGSNVVSAVWITFFRGHLTMVYSGQKGQSDMSKLVVVNKNGSGHVSVEANTEQSKKKKKIDGVPKKS